MQKSFKYMFPDGLFKNIEQEFLAASEGLFNLGSRFSISALLQISILAKNDGWSGRRLPGSLTIF